MNTEEVLRMVLEYAAKFKYVDVFNVLYKNKDKLPRTESKLPDILLAQVILHKIISRGNVRQFELAATIIDDIYRQNPACCSFKQFSRLLLGIKMKMLLHLLKNGDEAILNKLNKHIPRQGFSYTNQAPKSLRVMSECALSFRKFMLPLILDDRKRHEYFQDSYEDEYGASFLKDLQRLVDAFCVNVVSHLPDCPLEMLLEKQHEIPSGPAPSVAMEILLDCIHGKQSLSNTDLLEVISLLNVKGQDDFERNASYLTLDEYKEKEQLLSEKTKDNDITLPDMDSDNSNEEKAVFDDRSVGESYISHRGIVPVGESTDNVVDAVKEAQTNITETKHRNDSTSSTVNDTEAIVHNFEAESQGNPNIEAYGWSTAVEVCTQGEIDTSDSYAHEHSDNETYFAIPIGNANTTKVNFGMGEFTGNASVGGNCGNAENSDFGRTKTKEHTCIDNTESVTINKTNEKDKNNAEKNDKKSTGDPNMGRLQNNFSIQCNLGTCNMQFSPELSQLHRKCCRGNRQESANSKSNSENTQIHVTSDTASKGRGENSQNNSSIDGSHTADLQQELDRDKKQTLCERTEMEPAAFTENPCNGVPENKCETATDSLKRRKNMKALGHTDIKHKEEPKRTRRANLKCKKTKHQVCGKNLRSRPLTRRSCASFLYKELCKNLSQNNLTTRKILPRLQPSPKSTKSNTKFSDHESNTIKSCDRKKIGLKPNSSNALTDKHAVDPKHSTVFINIRKRSHEITNTAMPAGSEVKDTDKKVDPKYQNSGATFAKKKAKNAFKNIGKKDKNITIAIESEETDSNGMVSLICQNSGGQTSAPKVHFESEKNKFNESDHPRYQCSGDAFDAESIKYNQTITPKPTLFTNLRKPKQKNMGVVEVTVCRDLICKPNTSNKNLVFGKTCDKRILTNCPESCKLWSCNKSQDSREFQNKFDLLSQLQDPENQNSHVPVVVKENNVNILIDDRFMNSSSTAGWLEYKPDQDALEVDGESLLVDAVNTETADFKTELNPELDFKDTVHQYSGGNMTTAGDMVSTHFNWETDSLVPPSVCNSSDQSDIELDMLADDVSFDDNAEESLVPDIGRFLNKQATQLCVVKLFHSHKDLYI